MSKSAYKKKKSSSPAVNFTCMLLGMMTTTTLLLWGYQQVTAQPVEDPIVEVQTVDPNESKQPKAIAKDDLDKATPDELFVFLKQLEKWPRNAKIPVRIEYQERAIEVAELLLSHEDISKTKRNYSILSRIRAYTALYGLAILQPAIQSPELTEAIKATSLPYIDHEDEEINREALASVLRVSVFEYIMHEDESYQPTIESTLNLLLERHTDHPPTGVMVARVLNELADKDSKYAGPLIAKTADAYQASDNSAVFRIGSNLRETVALADSNLETLFRDRYVNGVKSQKDIYDATANLIAGKELGPASLTVISHTMNWFEEIKRGKAVTNLATRLLKTIDQQESESFRNQIKLTANAFLTRQELIGKPFTFSGEKIDHEFLNAANYKGHVTMLCFVRGDDAPCRQFMQRMSNQSQVFRNKGVRIMIVMPADELGYEEFVDKKERENWDFVIGNNEGSDGLSIFSQHPVTLYPSMTLIDHKGIVYRINIPFQQLNHEMEYLVGLQRKAASDNTNLK